MNSTREIGMKITAAQREFYRYTGPSAELERRGAGSSRPELAWSSRYAEIRRQFEEPEDPTGTGLPS